MQETSEIIHLSTFNPNCSACVKVLKGYQFFPEDILTAETEESNPIILEEYTKSGLLFSDTERVLIPERTGVTRLNPKPFHAPKQSCINHKGRLGRYAFDIPQFATSEHGSLRFYCRLCYHEQEIIIPQLDLYKLTPLDLEIRVQPDYLLDITEEKILSQFTSKWSNLLKRSKPKTISISRTWSNGVTTLASCTKCGKTTLSCRCAYDEL